MRSPRELWFRLNQLAANAAIFLLQPRLRGTTVGPRDVRRVIPILQDAEAIAAQILRHRFPILGTVIETGPEIEWRRDYVNGKASGTAWFKRIPYLDFEKVGDHKNIWELNRHQHLVVLAQVGTEECLHEIERQLRSWFEQNPFARGINWASALEVAFRALSWMWIDQLAGARLDAAFRAELWNGLYRHGLYLEHNLSTYFSPNTHLLGEALALHALGSVYSEFPRRWVTIGANIMREQLKRQIKPDGSHFEQSTYYHVYTLDMFRLHAHLAGDPPEFDQPLRFMTAYLAALVGKTNSLPFSGDDDGGRLFHPYGPRNRFGPESAGETTPSRSRLFPDAGMAVITKGGLHIIADVGPFGAGGAGHSHSDTLSFTMQFDGREILIDPGTYTYVADAKWRDWFRGSSAHNTIRIDGLDQADPTRPFRWDNKPSVRVREWGVEGNRVYLDAECSYRGFTHRRQWTLEGSQVLRVTDEVTGSPGEHLIERFWHLGEAPVEISARSFRIANVQMELDTEAKMESSWRSQAFGERHENPMLREAVTCELPWRGAATFVIGRLHTASFGRGSEGSGVA